MAITLGTIDREWSHEFQCPAVVLTGPRHPDEVIDFARRISALNRWQCEPEEEPDLVIHFQYPEKGKEPHVGPDVFTEDEVRTRLKQEMAVLDSASATQK